MDVKWEWLKHITVSRDSILNLTIRILLRKVCYFISHHEISRVRIKNILFSESKQPFTVYKLFICVQVLPTAATYVSWHSRMKQHIPLEYLQI